MRTKIKVSSIKYQVSRQKNKEPRTKTQELKTQNAEPKTGNAYPDVYDHAERTRATIRGFTRLPCETRE